MKIYWMLALLVGLALSRAAVAEPEVRALAGRQVAIWRPAAPHAPLVLFSHGFHGSNMQSRALMEALAAAGYLVVAPNHKDAFAKGLHPTLRPDEKFQKVDAWTASTYKDRADDLVEVVRALAADPALRKLYDPRRIALMGHSLGGYTVLGLAGAWPSWRTPEVKPCAVVALSPYCNPFLVNKTLPTLNVPVMYQGGTRDMGITPFLKMPNGAYDQTSNPKYFVEFNGAGHFTWTNLRTDQAEMISRYTIAFLDHYVKGTPPDPILSQSDNGDATLRFSAK